jgi:hypothetical protein
MKDWAVSYYGRRQPIVIRAFQSMKANSKVFFVEILPTML